MFSFTSKYATKDNITFEKIKQANVSVLKIYGEIMEQKHFDVINEKYSLFIQHVYIYSILHFWELAVLNGSDGAALLDVHVTNVEIHQLFCILKKNPFHIGAYCKMNLLIAMSLQNYCQLS